MEVLCVQIGLEAVVGGLVKTILGAGDRINKFESILADLKATLKTVSSKIVEIDRLKESNDVSNDELHRLKQVLEKAEQLVNRCSDVAWCNFCKKYRYSKMLQEMDESLRKIIDTDLQVAILVLLVETREMIRKLDQMNLRERDGNGRDLKRSRSQIFRMVSGLKIIVRSTPNWIIQYLSSFIRVRKWGYQKITKIFSP